MGSRDATNFCSVRNFDFLFLYRNTEVVSACSEQLYHNGRLGHASNGVRAGNDALEYVMSWVILDRVPLCPDPPAHPLSYSEMVQQAWNIVRP